jgi:TonB family protein
MLSLLPIIATGLLPLTDRGSWILPEDYPAEALRHDEAGTVEVELLIDDAGKPSNCRVIVSSSSALLDATTCALLLQRARFSPPGRTQTRSVVQRVSWQFESNLMPSNGIGVIADIALDHSGQVIGCKQQPVGKFQLIPGDACDFGPRTLGMMFGTALRRASTAHFRIFAMPMEEQLIAVEADAGSQGRRVFIDLRFEVTPSGFGTNCTPIKLDAIFEGTNPCDWFSGAQPDFDPEPARTKNRPMRLLVDSWVDK